jgi:hypothetical protein
MNEEKNSGKLLLIPLVFMIVGIGVFFFIQNNKKTATDASKQAEILLDKPFKLDGKALAVKKTTISTIDTNNFPLYKIDDSHVFFPSQKLAASMAKKLDVAQSGQNKWENEIYTLTFVENNSYIRIDFENTERKKIELKEEDLEKTASDFLKKIGTWPFSTNNFTTSTTIFEEENLNKVAAVTSFKETLESNEVYTDLSENAEIYVQFDEAGQITQIRYFYLPAKTIDASFKFKDYSDIETAIKAGEFKILNSTTEPVSIEIEKIGKVYFGSNTNNFLQPTFVIEGKDEYGEKLILLMPAFKKESYK